MLHHIHTNTLPKPGRAHCCSPAPRPQTVNHIPDHRRHPRAIHREINPVRWTNPPHPPHHAPPIPPTATTSQHAMRSPQPLRHLQPRRLQINGNHRPGPGDPRRGHHGGHPHGPDAKHGHRAAPRHAQRVEHRARPGLHAAPQRRVQRQLVGGRGRADADGAGPVDEGVSREGGLAEERGEYGGSLFFVAAAAFVGGRRRGGKERGGAVRSAAAKVALVEVVTVGRVARGARPAGLAVGKGEQDFVAGGDVSYGSACGEDHPRA